MGTFTPSDSDLGTYKEYSTVSESITFRDSVAPAQETKPVDITAQETNPDTITITDGDPATITGKYDEYFPKEIYYLTKSGEYKTATSFKQIDITEVDEIISYKAGTIASKTFNYDASVNYTEDSVTSPATLDWSYYGTSDATLETSVIYNPNYYGTPYIDIFPSGGGILVNDDYIIVTTINEDSKQGTNSGVVYIFDRETEELLYTLPNPNSFKSTDSNFFGRSLVVSDDYIVVGTYVNVVFVYSTSTKQLLNILESPLIDNANHKFGQYVSLSGDYLVVAAPFSTSKLYVYDLSQLTTTIVSSAKYTITMPSGYNITYYANLQEEKNILSIDTNFIAISVTSATSPYDESVFIYDIASFGTSSEITTVDYTLENPNVYGSSEDDNFGQCLQISGNYIAVSSPNEDSASINNVGRVYLYDISNFSSSTITSADYVLEDPNYQSNSSSGNGFGGSLAISEDGNYLIVGANAYYNTDVVYVYDISNFSSSTITSADYVIDSGSVNAGYRVSISGNYIVTSANPYVSSQPEAVQIYDISNFSSSIITAPDYSLSNPNVYDGIRTDDYYGGNLRLSGNNLVVAASGEESTDSSSGSGKVYFYDISTFTTSSIGSANYVFDNPGGYGTAQSEQFGYSAAVSGNRLVISAVNEDFLQNDTEQGYFTDSGIVYYYDMSTFTTDTPAVITTPTSIIDNPNTGQYDGYPEDRGAGKAGDYFGSSLAFNETYDYLMIGAYGTEDITEEEIRSGAVYVYQISPSNTFSLITKLYNPNYWTPAFSNSPANDYFGLRLATSGDYLAVGAYAEDYGTPPNYTDYRSSDGVVYVYDLSTMSGATITTSDYVLENPYYYTGSTSDQFGYGVYFSGTNLYVSSLADSPTVNSSGIVYVYDVSNFSSSPITTADFTILNPTTSSYFGGASVSGNYLAIGNPNADNASTGGKIHIYDTSSFSTSVITSADITINNPNDVGSGAYDQFGSFPLFYDDYLFAAAARESDSTDTYTNSGVVYKIVNVPSVVTTEEVVVDESKNYTITLENDWSVGQFDMATYGNYEQPPSRPYWLNKNGEKITWINNIKITTHWI